MRIRNNSFAENVQKRLFISTALAADKAVYHVQWHAKFFLDIRSAHGNRFCPSLTRCHPSIDDIKIGWIPDHLGFLLSSFIHSKQYHNILKQ